MPRPVVIHTLLTLRLVCERVFQHDLWFWSLLTTIAQTAAILGIISAWGHDWKLCNTLNTKCRQKLSFPDSTVSVKKKAENVSSVEEPEDDLVGPSSCVRLSSDPLHWMPPRITNHLGDRSPLVSVPEVDLTPRPLGVAWLEIARPEQVEVLFFTQSGDGNLC